MTRTISELTSHLGYWLRFVSNHVSYGFARKLEGMDVTAAEWVTLRELFDEDEIAPSRLADRIGLTRGAITKLADRLIAKKLVIRHASASDGRAQTLALTAKGRGLVPELAALADRNDEEHFGHLGAEERAQLERLLRGLAERHGPKTHPIA